MSIYLIYIIPNSDLQNVVIPIVAAVYGGLLTLVGVAWTIKHGQEERKQEEKQKAKPIFTFNMQYEELTDIKNKKICLDEDASFHAFKVIAELENSNHAPFILERLYCDGKWRSLEANTVVLPDKTVYLEFGFDDVIAIFLEIKDRLGCSHYYEVKTLSLAFLGFECDSPQLHTIRELKEVVWADIENRINNTESATK